MNESALNQPSVRVKREGVAERGSTESDSRLLRGVLRLALSFHGHSAILDAKLKELGALIRKGRRDAQLQQLIDEIVDTIVALDIQNKSGPDTSRADHLVEFLDRLANPGQLQSEIETIRRALEDQRDADSVLAAIERAAHAFSDVLDRGAATEAATQSARSCLFTLVERLPLSPALVGDASRVKRAIELAQDSAAFMACAQAIAALVLKARAELQAELDKLTEFLRGAARRLQDFGQLLDQSHEHHVGRTGDALQLSDTVRNVISELQAEVETASDIESLKSSVQSRLEHIGENLTTFVAAQKTRTAEATAAFITATSKLQELEAQTESLRGDLELQQSRVLMDPLTGVFNRTGYTEMTNKLYARWKRYGGTLSLAVIDLDLFKHINDHYGHAAGDRVLATVAGKLQGMIREGDVICRYGGEEFVLVLPDADLANASNLVEKIRASIEASPFRHKDTPVQITVSCGVAEFKGQDTLVEVFERADEAMYKAKKGGRNRVCAAPATALATSS